MPSANFSSKLTITHLCSNFFWRHSQHPNCITNFFSSSKSKLIFWRYFVNYSFYPS